MTERPSNGTFEPRNARSWSQIEAGLSYWLDALRHEEALSYRPRARPGTQKQSIIELAQPSTGQDYLKIAFVGEELAALEDLLLKGKNWTRLIAPQDGGFVEHILASLYLNLDRGRDEPLRILIALPVTLARGNELTGLIRVPVAIEFLDSEKKSLRLPSRAARRSGALPNTPVYLQIRRILPDSDQDPPCFIDTRFLANDLSWDPQCIDELFVQLRSAPQTIAAYIEQVTKFIEKRTTSDAAPTNKVDSEPTSRTQNSDSNAMDRASPLLQLASGLTQYCLAHRPRTKVFSYALLMDATRPRSTWHLQRDLQDLLQSPVTVARENRDALFAYLQASSAPARSQPLRALAPGQAPTARQREIAETFWDSPLRAISGPPGTGKTTVILHLCAGLYQRKIDAWFAAGELSESQIWVCSTNNRAVDNVCDALIHDIDPRSLPLALRVGSREHCEQSLLPQLDRILAWFDASLQQDLDTRKSALEHCRSTYLSLPQKHAQAHAFEQSQLDLQSLRAKQSIIESEIQSLQFDLSQSPSDEHSNGENAEHPSSHELQKVQTLCRSLLDLAESEQSTAWIRLIARARTELKPLLHQICAAQDLSQKLDAYLVESERLSPWTDVECIEWYGLWVDLLEEINDDVEDRVQSGLHHAKRAKLAQQLLIKQQSLAALQLDTPPQVIAPSEDLIIAYERDRFLHAKLLREAIAARNAKRYRDAVSKMRRYVAEHQSLRRFEQQEQRSFSTITQLFGVWGCTLLSLGNCISPTSDLERRMILDEAGQSHPAHAVSALMRAPTAMFLGDVHQLEAVVELSAGDESRIAKKYKPSGLPESFRIHQVLPSSAQALAHLADPQPGQLIDHFRCAPEIIRVSDRLCAYGLTVRTPPRRASNVIGSSLRFVQCPGHQEYFGGSWRNREQCEMTLHWLEQLLQEGWSTNSIAILTPYRAQLELLQRELKSRAIAFHDRDALDKLTRGTVHRLQGHERDIVIFSSVVTQAKALRFLNHRPNLLNVAISRARIHFMTLGCASTLASGEMTRWLIPENSRPDHPDAEHR